MKPVRAVSGSNNDLREQSCVRDEARGAREGPGVGTQTPGQGGQGMCCKARQM